MEQVKLWRQILVIIYFVLAIFSLRTMAETFNVTDYDAVPDDDILDTQAIQKAIDACAAKGGGTVRFSNGKYISGSLTLKNNVRLYLERGAILQGSDNYKDYPSGWNWGLLNGRDLDTISLEGEGVIDGVDCRNPQGEEGFRGPHGISLHGCTNISIKGITIKRAANYALICRNCSHAAIENVTIRGGHDGINAWDSNHFAIRNCDIRTGDDAIAGTANRDFIVSNCKINSSCNGFRFAGINVTVQNCKIWGPGEYKHKISKRNNMLAAFVHFSPKKKNSEPVSDNWLIENVTIDNAIHFYLYDYEKGLWQQGRPVRKVRFRNVKGRDIQQPITIFADGKAELELENVDIKFAYKQIGMEGTHAAGKESGYAFNIRNAARVKLRNVSIANQETLNKPVARFENVGSVNTKNFTYTSSSHQEPVVMKNVGDKKLSLDAWKRHQIDTLPQRSMFIDAADLDGDGHKDLVAGGWWWKNPGNIDGMWRRQPIGEPLRNMSVIYDVDRDGDMDIVGTQGVGSEKNNQHVWARNNAKGTFTILNNIQNSGEGDFLQGSLATDFGKDIKILLSWHNGGGGVQALTIPKDPGKERWRFSTLSEFTEKGDLSAGDIDRDGDLDILLGEHWLRNEKGKFTPFRLGHVRAGEADRNDLADVNGDGRLDAIIALENGTDVYWFAAPSDPTREWTRHRLGTVSGQGFSMDTADFDADGDPDVMIGEHRGKEKNRVVLFENQQQGTKWVEHIIDSGSTRVIDHHDGTVAVDLDDDGDLDIISIGWYNPKVWVLENKAKP
jgi:pectate lyase